jgi:hypothetical protein
MPEEEENLETGIIWWDQIYLQIPQATIMIHNQREGLVLFIMILLGISAAT